jgi:hypothetical protein
MGLSVMRKRAIFPCSAIRAPGRGSQQLGYASDLEDLLQHIG